MEYSFKNLIVWQKAHQFVIEVYQLTKLFPSDEKYGLTSQLKRAAVSVPANIVEGYRKKGLADKKRFYNISQGSLDECQYYLILAKDLGIEVNEKLFYLSEEVAKLLSGFIRSF